LVLLAGLFIFALKALERDRWLGMALLGIGLAAVAMKTRGRLAAALMAALLSLALLRAHSRNADKARVEDFLGEAAVIMGSVAREPAPSPGGFAFPLEVEAVCHRGKTLPAKGRAWVYAPPDIEIGHLDLIEITGEVRESKWGRRKSGAFISVGDARLLRKIGEKQEGLVEKTGRRVRARVAEVLQPVLPGGYRELHANLLGSLFFGTHGAGLPRDLIQMFRQTGTIHVLVVSGTQISLLFLLVYFPGLAAQWQRRQVVRAQLKAIDARGDIWPAADRLPGIVRPLPSPIIIAIGLALMSIYALLTQGGEPVARAAVMAGLIGGSHFLRHFPRVADHHGLDIDRYTLLAAAAIGILAISPRSLSDAGFQLSFAAVWGLLFLAPRLRGMLPTQNNLWAYLLVGPISAQLAIFPIAAWHFGQVPIIGLVSNLVVVPIAALLLWLGLAAFLAGTVWWVLAWPLGWLCGQLCWLMTRSVALFSQIPWGVFPVGQFPWTAAAGYFGILVIMGTVLGLFLLRGKDDDLEELERRL